MNNNSYDRQKKIIEILSMLHEDGDFEKAKKIFDETFSDVDVSEITSAERALISNGLDPMAIQRLCNVHASVFKGAIKQGEKVHAEDHPGHPVYVMKLENTVIHSLLANDLMPNLKRWQQSSNEDDNNNPKLRQKAQKYLNKIKQSLNDLKKIDLHYQRKENLFFPLMDKYGVTAPTKVMWGVDDEIRDLINKSIKMINTNPLPNKYDIEKIIEKTNQETDEMIFKEDNILFPMVEEIFTVQDWQTIANESDDIGYTLITQPIPWKPSKEDIEEINNKRNSQIAEELNDAAKKMADNQNIDQDQINAGLIHPQDINDLHEQMRKEEQSKHNINKNTVKNIDENINAKQEIPDYLKLKNNSANENINDNLDDSEMMNRIDFNIDLNMNKSTKSDNDDSDENRIINTKTGSFSEYQLRAILNTIPEDMTFVDKNGVVKWFSDSGKRIFARTTAVLGRKVINCHPPKSIHKVEKILSDFESGKSNKAQFWINHHGRKILICYYAVRDENDNYLGCLEASKDITEIQKLTGEHRLKDE